MTPIRDLIEEAHTLGLDTVGMTEADIRRALWERERADTELRTECHHRRLDATGTFGEVCHRLAQAIGIDTAGVAEDEIIRAVLQKRATVRELRKKCSERGLSMNGTEGELRSRLADSDGWATKIARFAASGIRSLLDDCVNEIVGERAPEDAKADGDPITPVTPLANPPHDDSACQATVEVTPPYRVPSHLLGSSAIPHVAVSRLCSPEVTPRQQILPTRLARATSNSAPDDLGGLRYAVYNAERVNRFLHSYRTNSVHPFYGFQGNIAALDAVIGVVQDAYSQFATDGERVFCTRRCPARLALIAPDENDRHDFASRLGRLISTPFVAINGAKIINPMHFIQLCSEG